MDKTEEYCKEVKNKSEDYRQLMPKEIDPQRWHKKARCGKVSNRELIARYYDPALEMSTYRAEWENENMEDNAGDWRKVYPKAEKLEVYNYQYGTYMCSHKPIYLRHMVVGMWFCRERGDEWMMGCRDKVTKIENGKVYYEHYCCGMKSSSFYSNPLSVGPCYFNPNEQDDDVFEELAKRGVLNNDYGSTLQKISWEKYKAEQKCLADKYRPAIEELIKEEKIRIERTETTYPNGHVGIILTPYIGSIKLMGFGFSKESEEEITNEMYVYISRNLGIGEKND